MEKYEYFEEEPGYKKHRSKWKAVMNPQDNPSDGGKHNK